MSSTWGENVKISVFGESHGPGIGVVIDGLPAGEKLDFTGIAAQMARRAPGGSTLSTARKESDRPEILSGLLQDVTTGAPLCALIRNSDTHSADYADLRRIPRPGHADYTAHVHYGGFNDIRGGGHFSGRLTAPMLFAGEVCRQILARRGVVVGAHAFKIAEVPDTPFDPVKIDGNTLVSLAAKPIAVLDDEAGARMKAIIEEAKRSGDSVGGIVECAAVGLPAGLGDPIFGGVENRLSSLLFGIPAVKGIEFGEGFGSAALRGSENNDGFYFDGDNVKTATNHHGGILGGITSGMPLIFRLAIKPTPSIFKEQQSVDLLSREEQSLVIHGRHDPCILPRAIPVVESLAALCLLDQMMGSNFTGGKEA